MYKFHTNCGDRVTLLNQNLTAIRNFVEFNHGLILSAEALTDDALFEVRIDRKVNVWNGCLEIGVTTLDPEFLELPVTASKLRNTAWILSGNSIIKDGVPILSSYGPELHSLEEGDCIAVSRSSKGELMFFINGHCLGIAAKDMPATLFAVIDLYGQCVQVSIVHSNNPMPTMEQLNEGTSSEACALPVPDHETHIEMPEIGPLVAQDKLRFHPRCGLLVKLSNNNRSAERARPLDDYNNGVVMTHRPLFDSEYFGIRIDKLVDKWSGSIEVGVSAHNPATIRYPTTMTNMNTGTIMMSGCKVLINGQGACMEYGNFNLDELQKGDTVGMMKKSSGKLHFFINGVDQGMATNRVPQQVWGVVDLYGMTVKVSVVHPWYMDSNVIDWPLPFLSPHYVLPDSMTGGSPDDSPGDSPGDSPDNSPGNSPGHSPGNSPGHSPGNSPGHSPGHSPSHSPVPPGAYGGCADTAVQMPAEDQVAQPSTSSFEPAPGCSGLVEEDQLLFHTLRDSHVIIINNGRTAHRINAFEIFNNGFAMTNRTLKTNELFQVRLDLVITKWAGNIEIGVTQYSSNDADFPFRVVNTTPGTWGITGEDAMKDGAVLIPKYVRNLSGLVEGDTVGVMRKDFGILHFFINGVDQGPAAYNLPDHVFGVIDLYGRAAQATIVDTYTPPTASAPESPVSVGSSTTVLPDMCFHRVHGNNARLSRNRLTASRSSVFSEFNDAVLFSSRPLRECVMFEIKIESMVDYWIGSLEIGVTAIRPDDMDAEGAGGLARLANTATDLIWDTYVLSGTSIMKDGLCVRGGYQLDLDTLTVGSRVGVMWHSDRSLHYYLDGIDMGMAWYVPHVNLYAVVDLYGQCTQVTIQNEERVSSTNGFNPDQGLSVYLKPTPPLPYWSFSEYHGENVTLSKDYTVARRLSPEPMGALVFSSTHLILNELYEIRILDSKHIYAGSFRMGVTDVNVLNANINRNLPLCASRLPHFTAFINGKYLEYSRPNKSQEKDLRSFVPSFEWLRPGDRIGFKKISDSKVVIYYNSELLEVSFENVPDKVYVLMELYGTTTKIETVSRGTNVVPVPNDKPVVHSNAPAPSGGKTDMLEVPTNNVLPDMVDSGDKVEVPATDEPRDTPPTPPQSDLPDETSPQDTLNPDAVSDEENACVLPAEEVNVLTAENGIPPRDAAGSTSDVQTVRERHGARPYTFHYITGTNIRLCSSDTVAVRFRGYSDAVAVSTQQLLRGMAFRFRVDKVTDEWEGTMTIGALAMLPTEIPPSSALHFTVPCWVVTNNVLYSQGVYTLSDVGRKLEEITENSVLTLHFQLNSELTLEIDGVLRGVIGTIPPLFNHIYPTIDLYGKIVQVSILLHPHVILGGTSLDLPMIEESPEGKTLPLQQPGSESDADADHDVDPYAEHNEDFSLSSEEPEDYLSYHRERMRSVEIDYSDLIDGFEDDDPDDVDRTSNAADDDNSNPTDDASSPLVEAQLIQATVEVHEPMAGPSSAPDDRTPVFNANDAKNYEIKARSWPFATSIHQSLLLHDECIVADNDLAAESRGFKKSQSTQLFSHSTFGSLQGGHGPDSHSDSHSDSDESSSEDLWINPLGLGLHIMDDGPDSSDEIEDTCDTNIRHNDRYPEANETNDSNDGYDASDAIDDNFENVFMDAMFLETSNMPDLNEEQSLSVDESTTTRRDDYWADGLTVENLHYLNGIICWDQRVTGARVEHRDWVFYSETNGNCEVMHLALKFWNQVIAPYSDMREVVTSGNVHCFCNECHPDADSLYAGWVRIERPKAQEVVCSQPVRVYWHVMRATITSALALSDVTESDMRRPRNFYSDPSTSPDCADTWIDEEGKPHQAALALDVDVGGQDAESDRLIAYWIYLKSHAMMMQEAVEDIEDTVEDAVDDILEDAVDDIVEEAVDEAMLHDTTEGPVGDLAMALMDDTLGSGDDKSSHSELVPAEPEE